MFLKDRQLESKEDDEYENYYVGIWAQWPEAIKMCSLVNELKTRECGKTIVCVTGQHRQMLGSSLEAFPARPDYDLSITKDR